jgi:16S rRNA (uracil1498-N3)-methyltransferase
MNALPLFHFPALQSSQGTINLTEEIRKHAVTVLRMQVGEQLMLTDGKGFSATAEIVQADKKQLMVALGQMIAHPAPQKKMILGISLLKNTARFEWMLEKVTEIGITEIIPLLAERTERQHFRQERFQQILVSACLQSGQFHFPILHEPVKLATVFSMDLPPNKFIAHCMEGDKPQLTGQSLDSILLIGPEGDFTAAELDLAVQHQYKPVGLGESRLRTETAGIVGAVLLRG